MKVTDKSESYVRHLQENKEIVTEYYRKSLVKTEQQKFLEKLLHEKNAQFSTIADLACGGGTLSFHLSTIFPEAQFHLTDLNIEALDLAREICKGERFHFSVDNLFELNTLKHNSFDAVFCWQTLLLFDKVEELIFSVLRLLKPGGKAYFMSLFNLDCNVDIFAKILDHTRDGKEKAEAISYNTISRFSIERILTNKVQDFEIYRFDPVADISYNGKGLGTNTVLAGNKRLQISGGYLMNWGLLEITK